MSSPDPSGARKQRTYAWIAIAVAGLALAISVFSWSLGNHVSWIAWILPLLIAANVGTSTFGWLRPWPRLARLFPYLSITVALVIIVAEVVGIFHP